MELAGREPPPAPDEMTPRSTGVSPVLPHFMLALSVHGSTPSVLLPLLLLQSPSSLFVLRTKQQSVRVSPIFAKIVFLLLQLLSPLLPPIEAAVAAMQGSGDLLLRA